MAAAAMMLLACGRPQQAQRKPHGMFTDEVRLRTTPVKNQGRSQLCWIYGMLATIETDRIMAGDSVNLSPDYPARMWMAHLARRSFLSGGRERVDMRGMAPMTLALAAEYGMMTYDPYNCGGDANYNVLARRLTAMARRSHSMSLFDSRCTDILDESLGYMPSRFWLYGVEYSPRQLARSLFLPGDYTALTSFTHHPMGDTFALEVPDNKTACHFLNVPVATTSSTCPSTRSWRAYAQP
ncbi:peptidase C1-like protein [Prevotella sp. CAG:487]|nr:peptidase C1-like protein [Prevotella sp. CAG:487]